jgi:hypothetical protein
MIFTTIFTNVDLPVILHGQFTSNFYKQELISGLTLPKLSWVI